MRKIGEGDNQMKEDAGAPKGMNFAKFFFPTICDSAGIYVRDETLRVVLARSICASQHDKNTTCSEHIWMLTC